MKNDANDSGASLAIGIVLGAVVGAGLALLLAPRTGKETRRRLADAGERWSDAARRQLDRQIDHAGEIASDIERQARAMAERS